MKMKNIILSALFTCVLSCNFALAQSNVKVIAHRGYWDTPGSTQNSLVALHRANEVKVYGSEFDVLITADGIPVVNHDNDIQGYIIEKTEYSKLRDLKIKNGETLPTLEQYLIHGKANKNTRLILEIKPHSTKEVEDRAVREIVKMVEALGVKDQTEYISFSFNICKEIVKLNPKAQVAFLGSKVTPKEIKDAGLTGVDFNYSRFEKNPNLVKECHDLGLTVNVWTVNDPEMMKRLIDLKVDFITTDKPEVLLEILK